MVNSSSVKSLLVAVSALCISLCWATTINAGVGIVVPENSQHAWQAPLASSSLLISISRSGEQTMWVAGERGHILGNHGTAYWQQSKVATQVLLTAIDMFDDRYGWAVGHDAVILKTVDGGASWQQVYQNIDQQAPLLDVIFISRQNGIAIGAYGYYLYTADGGKTWQHKLLNEEHDFHLNAISQNSTGDLYIAAEAGHIYRSTDSGESWTSLPSPYAGSLFDVLSWGSHHVAISGLRGNLYVSTDRGESWKQIPTAVESSLNSLIRLKNGQLLAVGHAGIVLLVNADFTRTQYYQLPDRKALADAYEFSSNQLLLVGESGIQTLDLCGVFKDEALGGCF